MSSRRHGTHCFGNYGEDNSNAFVYAQMNSNYRWIKCLWWLSVVVNLLYFRIYLINMAYTYPVYIGLMGNFKFSTFCHVQCYIKPKSHKLIWPQKQKPYQKCERLMPLLCGFRPSLLFLEPWTINMRYTEATFFQLFFCAVCNWSNN